jgi:hypothetical protein
MKSVFVLYEGWCLEFNTVTNYTMFETLEKAIEKAKERENEMEKVGEVARGKISIRIYEAPFGEATMFQGSEGVVWKSKL